MNCPICKKTVEEPTNDKPSRWFPFCSERCKLIDLGRWLDGKYQVPVVIAPEDEESRNDE